MDRRHNVLGYLTCLFARTLISDDAVEGKLTRDCKTLDRMVSARQDYVKIPSVPELILTKTYMDGAMHEITEALNKITEPLSMLKLQRSLELHEPLFYALMEQIAKNYNSGIFRGRRDRCIFEPQIYRDHQMALIRSLLEAADYIEYHTVELHYPFGSPKDILQKLHPNMVFLETCAVTSSLVETLASKVEETQEMNSWLDFSKHVPFAFSTADTTALLDTIVLRMKKKPKPVILGSQFVTTPAYLTQLVESAQKFLNRRAQDQKEQRTKKKTKQLNMPIELTEDEIYQYLVDEGADDAFASCVAPVIKKPMSEALAKAIKSVYLPSFDSWLEQQKQHTQKILNDTGCRIYYTYQSVLLFEDESARKSLEKYIIRQLCMEFLYYLVILRSMQKSDDMNAVLANVGLSQEEIGDSALVGESRRMTVIRQQTETDESLSHLYQSLIAGKRASAFINYLTDTMDSLKEEETKRKTNRGVLQLLARQLESTPMTEKSGPSVLHLTTILYFQSVNDLPLYVSGKYVPLVLEQIRKQVGQNETVDLLCSSRDMVMACLKSRDPMDLSLLDQVSLTAKRLLKEANV
ncbi:E3 UFM1-protein ligase 1 [Apophysomyces ossiformis]|uniref:E3 UFM1-protein ligase 1 n=1 Tax=Apophysomyces ossiformis TaxID=679940 RepID=A0A8H7BVT2_9FUNG|nr:E3 UFM1-protein ligase 1 [Apophysomyces ossiformis]